ncbi:glycosyltransferase [Dyadobacter bucti]|uniref:glycosyltransferase n=1 Tax=Dyadobacter bucti TaxID=2572203 RepID=UPI00110978CE|nr:glycosyltransferase [Dyadobacter bucti]
MLSVIICSANAKDLSLVKKNIERTIGVPHEILGFDNSAAQKGICEIYNEGTRQAKFDMLCFMHEDIEMLTDNWGKKVLDIFANNEKLGLLGIAGGGYKSLAPASWYNYHLQENGGFYCNLVQGYKHTGKPDMKDCRNPGDELLSRVACVDGCWFCTSRKVALKYPFDQKLLRKFHGYDLDFGISISGEFEAAVTFEILLKHFSEGNFNKVWMDEILKVHQKWAAVLPINVAKIPESHLKRIERHALEVFLQQSLNDDYYSKWELLKLIWSTRHSRIASLSFPYKLMVRLLKMKKGDPIT